MAKGDIRKFLAVMVASGLVVAGCTETEADKKKTAKKELEKKQALIEKQKQGFHCLSGWDGSHLGVERWIKKNLRDPDSYQHIETRISPVKDGKHSMITQYRAKNGFGGYVVEAVLVNVDNQSCQATVVAKL